MIKLIFRFLTNEKYRPLIMTAFVMLGVGTVVFHFAEGWRWLDSFYYCVITLATVGYGDFTPHTDIGKIAAIFYIMTGLGIFLAFVQAFFDYVKENRKNR